MMAKEVRFSKDAREAMLKGVNTLADAVRVTLRSEGTQCRIGEGIWFSADHQ